MSDVVIYVMSAILLLAIGAGLGFWFGQRRGRGDAARSGDLQQEFDAYRQQVTEHFGQTAGHFLALGERVRELYDHMAEGAETLCDQESAGRRIEFSAAKTLDAPEKEDAPVSEPPAAAEVPDPPEQTAAEGAESQEADAEPVGETPPEITVPAADEPVPEKRSIH